MCLYRGGPEGRLHVRTVFLSNAVSPKTIHDERGPSVYRWARMWASQDQDRGRIICIKVLKQNSLYSS